MFWYYFSLLFKLNSLLKKILKSWLFSLCCEHSSDESGFVRSCWGCQSKPSCCHSRMWGQAEPAGLEKGKAELNLLSSIGKPGKAALLRLYRLQGSSHLKNFPFLRLHFSGRRYLVVVKPWVAHRKTTEIHPIKEKGNHLLLSSSYKPVCVSNSLSH